MLFEMSTSLSTILMLTILLVHVGRHNIMVCLCDIHDCSSCAHRVIIRTYLGLPYEYRSTVTQAVLQDRIHEGYQHKHSDKHVCKGIKSIKAAFISPSSKKM